LVIALLGCCQAHMSIWVPSMWGVEQNPTSDFMVQPLENYNFDDWWMHGKKALSLPPPAGVITLLRAGGTIDFEITGNKWWTSMGVAQGGPGLCSPNPGDSPRNPPNPWDNGMNNRCNANIHAPKRVDVSACALAIAYKSVVTSVEPSDFTVFSVAYDCIARTLQTFDIPALPACPRDGCVCSWFWIHNSIGGTDQMYMTPFKCNITNFSVNKIGTPVPPVRCDGKPPYNGGPVTTTCHKVQQPMYWANNQGNNMANPVNTQSAPTYVAAYGFPDGAQHQIFTNALTISNSIGDTLLTNGDGESYISSANPQTIMVSPSRNTGSKLTIQNDGNLLLTDMATNTIRWTSNTAGINGTAPYSLILQKSGNLEIVDSHNKVYWQTNTANIGFAPYKLKLRDILSLSVVDSNGTPIWSAKI